MLTVKNPPKNQIRNFVKLTVHTYACHGLTDFNYEVFIENEKVRIFEHQIVFDTNLRSKIIIEIVGDCTNGLHH